MNKQIKGFTLIELLVVVLIIGILAAVALPQYQKAVEKSKSAQAVTILKSVYQAAEEYYLANGTWPKTFEDLSVVPSWTETTKWHENVSDVLSNKDWSLQITTDGYVSGLAIGRLAGKYAGGGFVIWHQYPWNTHMPLDEIICAEKVADITTPGDYCQKVMQAMDYISSTSLRYYKMP